MSTLSVEDAVQYAKQSGFSPINLGDAYCLLPADRRGELYGFARLHRRTKQVERNAKFFARVRATEEQWTAFFASIRQHALTRKHAAHQFNDALSTFPPSGGQFASIVESQHERRLNSLDFDPEELPQDILTQAVLVRGAVLMHSCEKAEADNAAAYRMKRTKVARDDNSPFFVDWPMLCEFATVWGRDLRVFQHFPWGADPLGVVHPDPEGGFEGWRLVRPYDPSEGTSIPRRVRVKTPTRTQEVVPMPIAVETEPTTAEASPGTDSRLAFSGLELLLHHGTLFLEQLPEVAADQTLEIFAQTLRPAAENLLRLIREQGVEMPDVPALSELTRTAEQAQALDARAEELRAREAALDEQGNELAQLAQSISAREAEVNGLLELVDTSLNEMFAQREQRLLEQQTSVRAEAAKLDELKEQLRKALN